MGQMDVDYGNRVQKGMTEMTDEQYMRIVSDPQHIQISDLRDENDRLRAENEALKAKLESGLWFSAVEVAEIGTMINTAKRLQAENEEWRQINDSTDFEYKKLKAELDAAKYDLRICDNCDVCKYGTRATAPLGKCDKCHIRTNWEWRGPCAENGGKDA